MGDRSQEQPANRTSADQLLPLPDGWRLAAADDLRTKAAGRILIGGAPLKIIRLSTRGATLSRSWFAGEAISADPSHQGLARRLIDAGMAHPRPPLEPQQTEPPEPQHTEEPQESQSVSADSLTVVIPVKDDQAGLDATLTSLLHPEPSGEDAQVDAGVELDVIVVDDGSQPPVVITDDRIRVLRNSRPSGPGQARQHALGQLANPLVAFVDAGVVITRSDLGRLTAAMADPALVAVAPRVTSAPEDHIVGRYDRYRSPIDLGPAESLVGPGRLVPYVPTACVLARTEAVRQAGGFDPDLRYGEDVDLIWRLGRFGGIRYVSHITARHSPRSNLWEMIRQRRGYGSAAAPLAVRHGDAVAPCSISPWSLLVTGLVMTGHPVAGLGAAISTGFALKPKIKPLPDLTAEALHLTLRGHWYGGLSVLTAMARTWSPLVITAALLLPSKRRRLLGLLGAAFCRRLLDGPRRPGPAVLDVGVGVVDDVAYAAGVMSGVVRLRSLRALKPSLTSWPKPPGRET